MSQSLKVAVTTPLSEELCQLVEQIEPRAQMLRDQSLLPPMRWPGDHQGDPQFTRTPEQDEAFKKLIMQGQASYGIPDENSQLLAWAVRNNPELRWVQTMAAGGGGQVKAAELSADELERVQFTTSAGVHGSSLAEFAVFGVFAGAKDLPRLAAQKADKNWTGRWCMKQVSDMTVLVVGLGGIGRACVEKFHALADRVIVANRSEHENPLVDELFTNDRLNEAVAQADAIVVTLPGTEYTNGLISADVLAHVKPGAILVSVGRGTVIDEPALIDALNDGRIGFAALDVFATEPLPEQSPLWTMDNVVVSPHTAALDAREDRRIAELFAHNATRFLDGEQMLNPVNTVEFY